jgi:hypothetical protein
MSTRSRVPARDDRSHREICPESGVWEVVGSPSTTEPISRGDRMSPNGSVHGRITHRPPVEYLADLAGGSNEAAGAAWLAPDEPSEL